MAAPSTPDAVMSARAALRGQRAVLVDAIDAQALAQRKFDAAARANVDNPADPNNPVTIARNGLNQANTNLANARTAEQTSRAALASAITTWLTDGAGPVSTDNDVARLQASQAIVMFPVRMETRFGTSPANLRVRIYPDEIAVDTHESALTLDEEAAGVAYYTGLSLTNTTEEEKRWQVLAGRFGAPRAAYIARVMRPFMKQDGSYYSSYMQCNTNWTNEPPSDTPTFPALPHRPDAWTRPAEAILPDRWVLAGYRGGQRIS